MQEAPPADSPLLAWLHLALTPGIGPVHGRRLLARVGQADAHRRLSPRDLAEALGSEPLARALLRDDPERDAGIASALAWQRADPAHHLITQADAAQAAGSRTFDLTARREKRAFSRLSLVAEISRYLNRSPLEIEQLLDATKEGTDELVAITNEFNELIYDEIIPRLFHQLYDLDESQQTEEHEVDLIKLPPNGYYEVSAAKDKIVRMSDTQINDQERAKSFHLDTYCFDSGS